MSETSLFLVSYAPRPAPLTTMHFHPLVLMSLLHGRQCALCLLFTFFTKGHRFGHSLLLTHFPIMQKLFRAQKTHTLKNSQHHFCFLFSLQGYWNWLFSVISCQNRKVPVCKGDNPNIKYEIFEPMCIRTLFSSRAHSTSLIMALLHLCGCLKLADFFSRNFTFDSQSF